MIALREQAPGKVNLCLFLGPTRADGRHELVTVFQPLTLADEVSLTPGPLGAVADEVVCPGVEGDNLAAAALRAFRARTGWAGGAVRLTIDKRIPVAAGMAGGSADAGAALRLAARAAGIDDDALLLDIAAGLGADVPAQVRPGRALATGVGDRLEPLGAPPAYGVAILPSHARLSTADVFREADRLGLARDAAGLAERLAAVRADRGRPAGRAARQRPRSRPRCRCARRSPTRWSPCAAAGARPRARLRVGADRRRAVRRPDRRPRRGGDARRPRSAPGRGHALGRPRVKPVWLVFAAAVVAYVLWRRKRLEKTALAFWAVVATAALVYGLGLVHLPNLEKSLISIGETLGPWTYALVGALAFLETGAFIGLLAPGETAMLLGGLVAGQGKIDVLTMIAIAWTAAVAGDVTSFFLGRRLGRGFMERHGPRVKITEERLQSVEGFFDRHGGKAILLGRFVGLVRAVAPFLAGSSGMPLRRFIPYDVIGAGLWSGGLILLGYIFWQSFSKVVEYAKKGALGLGIAITLVVGIVWLVRWLRRAENRAAMRDWVMRQRERPVIGPVVRAAEPVARGAGRRRGSSGTASPRATSGSSSRRSSP